MAVRPEGFLRQDDPQPRPCRCRGGAGSPRPAARARDQDRSFRRGVSGRMAGPDRDGSAGPGVERTFPGAGRHLTTVSLRPHPASPGRPGPRMAWPRTVRRLRPSRSATSLPGRLRWLAARPSTCRPVRARPATDPHLPPDPCAERAGPAAPWAAGKVHSVGLLWTALELSVCRPRACQDFES